MSKKPGSSHGSGKISNMQSGYFISSTDVVRMWIASLGQGMAAVLWERTQEGTFWSQAEVASGNANREDHVSHTFSKERRCNLV